MQKFIFVSRYSGVSKNGKPYDMTSVSDGFQTFPLSNANGVGDKLEKLSKGDTFEADVNISQGFNGLQGQIVNVKLGS
jgi:hypothetical protein